MFRDQRAGGSNPLSRPIPTSRVERVQHSQIRVQWVQLAISVLQWACGNRVQLAPPGICGTQHLPSPSSNRPRRSRRRHRSRNATDPLTLVACEDESHGVSERHGSRTSRGPSPPRSCEDSSAARLSPASGVPTALLSRRRIPRSTDRLQSFHPDLFWNRRRESTRASSFPPDSQIKNQDPGTLAHGLRRTRDHPRCGPDGPRSASALPS